MQGDVGESFDVPRVALLESHLGPHGAHYEAVEHFPLLAPATLGGAHSLNAAKPVGVVGSGSWGTALATHFAAAGHAIRLWARREEVAREIRTSRRNATYLPGIDIHSAVEPTSDLADLSECSIILMVVPSHGYREALGQLLGRRENPEGPVIVSATKGIETESLCRMSEVTAQELDRVGADGRFAVLSGPSFAVELAAGTPTAAVIAAEVEGLAADLQVHLATPLFRLYSSDDVIGVELGGTAKNVIAIAAGVVAGLGLGHNTQAALITRGLHEITRLGVGLGWGGADLRRSRRSRGPGPDLHRGPVAESPDRAGARGRQEPGADQRRDVVGRRGSPQLAGRQSSRSPGRYRDADHRADGRDPLRRQGRNEWPSATSCNESSRKNHASDPTSYRSAKIP